MQNLPLTSAELITLIGIAITFLSSLASIIINYFLVKRRNQHENEIEIRKDWIHTFRNEMAEILTSPVNSVNSSNDIAIYIQSICTHINKVKLFLKEDSQLEKDIHNDLDKLFTLYNELGVSVIMNQSADNSGFHDNSNVYDCDNNDIFYKYMLAKLLAQNNAGITSTQSSLLNRSKKYIDQETEKITLSIYNQKKNTKYT